MLLNRGWIFRVLLSLIAFMLIVNGFLFIKGLTNSTGAWGELPLPATDNVLLFYDSNAPTIRFRSSLTGDLVVVVPSKDTPAHLISTAQAILSRFKQRVPLVPQAMLNHSINRLKRILRPSYTSTFTNINQSYVKGVWASIQQWPYSDSLRLPNLGNVLSLTRSARIESATAATLGTQLKIEVELEGGQKAFFKPEWYPRNVKLQGTPYTGKDRHFGEIAAFYLNLLLGFYNASIVTGRKLDPTSLEVVASQKLKNTFSHPNGSVCFYGVCKFCVSNEPVCASEGETVEGNGDRHHFELTSSRRGEIGSRFLLLDNGKSFGNSQEDYIDLLAPLFQCCKVRESLINTLKKWEGSLGKSLDSLTKSDPLYPLLPLDSGHLNALDRRLRIVLATVDHCMRHKDRKVLY